MASVDAGKKRKRNDAAKTVQFKKPATQAAVKGVPKKPASQPKPAATPETQLKAPQVAERVPGEDVHIQIVTGSYERVLHGISATIPREALSKPATSTDTSQDETGTADSTVSFSDTFLFAAHASSIRCLAISPPTGPSKRTLATGGSDERINLYGLSTAPPPTPKPSSSKAPVPSLLATSTNSRNRSLGNLIHHDRAITNLHFPSKAKLFSGAEDNAIAISRMRDWTMLSSIKAPIPKPVGRPSGDTAGPGETPAGVNDFAVHPSQKLMLSVGRGERCMRLWNLITGKKAGVLNFEREVLAQVGEGRFGTGEGRKVLWDKKGEAYVVGFERGAVVFGIDSKAKAVVKSDRPTKFHQMRFLPGEAVGGKTVLAVSTEDGRVLFFDLSEVPEEADPSSLPQCHRIAQLGGRAAGIAGRIKDFEILQPQASASEEAAPLVVATASSDGAVRIWGVSADDLTVGAGDAKQASTQVGTLIGTLETSNRITCLTAFLLDGEAVDETNGEANGGAAEEDEAESGSEDDDEDSE